MIFKVGMKISQQQRVMCGVLGGSFKLINN